jgi:DNA polymerase elongation subunit (family B)/ribosomal protein S27AE
MYMDDITKKPWYDAELMATLYSRDDIQSDEDVARHFESHGFIVSRRAITDARNSLGLPAKTRSAALEAVIEAPRILFLDIETRPNLGYFWRLYDENIGVNQLVDEHQVLCFAGKWLGVDGIEFYSSHRDGKEGMVHEAHRMLDEADVVMHWNGKKFDIPHLNKEFVMMGLEPPSTFKQVDLMMVVRSRFKFASNKLQHISKTFGLEGKFDHEGFDLWVKCMAGENEAWETMAKYNKQDVILLEQIYEKILPWIKSHPSVPLYRGVGKCPNCGSDSIIARGKAYTNLRTYQRYKCSDCGAWMRGNKYIESTDLISVSY